MCEEDVIAFICSSLLVGMYSLDILSQPSKEPFEDFIWCVAVLGFQEWRTLIVQSHNTVVENTIQIKRVPWARSCSNLNLVQVTPEILQYFIKKFTVWNISGNLSKFSHWIALYLRSRLCFLSLVIHNKSDWLF
jgi:hypothetical protein